MKSAPFAYHAPTSIDEAVALLEPGGEVRVLAGGQSLMQLMKFRRVKPRVLVDINRVAGLEGIEERDGELVVGALVRQQTLLDDALAARSWPLIGEALQYAGYRETRHRGTVGGSLAFAAAWAELTAVAVALDAAIEVRSQRGARTIAAREFFRGPNATALGDDELIRPSASPPPRSAVDHRSTRSALAIATTRRSAPLQS
jgi:carbon-monoxide dehydrogenase medium subunit